MFKFHHYVPVKCPNLISYLFNFIFLSSQYVKVNNLPNFLFLPSLFILFFPVTVIKAKWIFILFCTRLKNISARLADKDKKARYDIWPGDKNSTFQIHRKRGRVASNYVLFHVTTPEHKWSKPILRQRMLVLEMTKPIPCKLEVLEKTYRLPCSLRSRERCL